VLNAQIASEDGEFNMADVLKGIYDKIIRRHPHVFGDVKLDGVQGVLTNWEKLKAVERSTSHEPEKGMLDGVPLALPALAQAQEYQDRASRVGFDWKEVSGVLDKIAEEIQEVKDVTNEQQLIDELGDLLFSLVNLARWKKVDAESALRATSQRFKNRFAYVERGAKKQGRKPSEMTIDEMETLWQEAKSQ
jgi:tetrapyrrole methylase family protein/MazG family protein